MRKKLLIALAAIVAVLAILLIFIASQPSEYHVERSSTIEAAPPDVFAQVNDFHNWQSWSPWAELDPNAENSFAGPQAGEGAVFRWSGNDDVGKGSMTIVESLSHDQVRIKLEFVEPFEDACDVAFHLQPRDEGTFVTWTMDGKNNLIGKAMCLFMDMDEMIGDKYDEGLANLKKLVEANTSTESPAP